MDVAAVDVRMKEKLLPSLFGFKWFSVLHFILNIGFPNREHAFKSPQLRNQIDINWFRTENWLFTYRHWMVGISKHTLEILLELKCNTLFIGFICILFFCVCECWSRTHKLWLRYNNSEHLINAFRHLALGLFFEVAIFSTVPSSRSISEFLPIKSHWSEFEYFVFATFSKS